MKFINEKENKNFSGIYKITQISNGKVYIGQTKMRLIKRYWHHVWKLKNNSHDNKHLQNAWNKYGEEDFQFEIVHELDKHEDMNKYEIMYISIYDSYKNGFNMTTGGEGKKDCPTTEHAKMIIGQKNKIHNTGKKHSEETRLKMRISSPHRKLTPDHITKLTKSRLEKGYSKESRQKMRETHLGSNNSVSNINETQASEIKSRLINGFSMVEIARDLDINYDIIKSVLHCKCWNQVYVEGWDDFIREYSNKKKKIISDEKVREIRLLLEHGYTAEYIAEKCNVGISVVYGIKQNRTYKNVI